MAGLPGRLREHSNPLLKYVLEVKQMAGFPGRLKEHSNPLLKYVLKVKKWPGFRGGSGSTAILY